MCLGIKCSLCQHLKHIRCVESLVSLLEILECIPQCLALEFSLLESLGSLSEVSTVGTSTTLVASSVQLPLQLSLVLSKNLDFMIELLDCLLLVAIDLCPLALMV